MTIAEMLLWILGATLVAVYAGTRLWAGYERQEGVIPLVEARERAPAGPVNLARVPESTPIIATVKLPAPVRHAVIAALEVPGIERATTEVTQFHCFINLPVAALHDAHVLGDTGEPVLAQLTCQPLSLVDNVLQQPCFVRSAAAEGRM
jgi:hypothetical protein